MRLATAFPIACTILTHAVFGIYQKLAKLPIVPEAGEIGN
jgi:hypothetical protein